MKYNLTPKGRVLAATASRKPIPALRRFPRPSPWLAIVEGAMRLCTAIGVIAALGLCVASAFGSPRELADFSFLFITQG